MKKTVVFFLVIAILICALSSCACKHDFATATCTKPATCTKCGETQGEALGHSFNAATCTTPATCTKCGETQGTSLGHSFNAATCTTPATCSKCGETQGTALGHDYSIKECGNESLCSRCGISNGVILTHTTDRGICERCGAYYISIENQLADEKERHLAKINEIETAYNSNYDSYYIQYYQLSAQLSYSEYYIEQQVLELESTISSLQTRIAISELDTSAQGRSKTRQLNSQLASVQNDYYFFLSQKHILDQMDTCKENLIYLNSKYSNDIQEENQLYESNIAKINSSEQ